MVPGFFFLPNFLIKKISYFADTTERGDRGWKQAQRQGEEKVTLQITLMCRVTFEEVMCSKNEGLLLLKALVEGATSPSNQASWIA